MRKFSRSLLWTGLVAAGVVACGDDVTITPPPPPPPPPPPTVHSISVAPSGVTLSHPTTQQMTAAVNADPGVATTVTWSAAPATVATISATGLLTTVGSGNVAVQACSTVVTSVCGVATLTVTTQVQTVTQVTVTPAAATITRPATGSTTLQLSAAVSGANNPSQSVTWSVATPGLGATVTVSATGLVTVTSAAAGGTVNISACSTVTGFTNVCGFSAITIAIPAPTTISIQSITTGATFIPVNINNVVGQIEVTVNMEPGDQVVQGVDVLIDGVVAATQNFSALEWEAASAKALARRAAGEENAKVLLVFSINTAEYDCIKAGSAVCTGATTWQNGPRALSARARIANLTPVATQVTTLIFNNANGIHVKSFTTTGTTANATSIAGLRYDRGALSVTIVPVIFNVGQTMAAAAGTAVIFGNPGCDASGIGPRTLVLTAPAAGGTDWTATFSQTAAAGVTNVTNYEFNGCAAFLAIGESVFFNAVDNNGDQLFPPGSTPLNVNALTSLRLDNRAPGAPTFMANPNTRLNGWVNIGSASNPLLPVAANTGATSNGWQVNTAAVGTGCIGTEGDCGVGIGAAFAAAWYNRCVRFGAGPTVAAANAATASCFNDAAALVAPAETPTNLSQCAVISARDALGNESALPAAATACSVPPGGASTPVLLQHLLFGQDVTLPTIAWNAGSFGEGARIAVSPLGGEFITTVNDPGAPATASGISGARWLLRNTNAAGTTSLTGSGAATAATAPTATGAPACGAGICSTAIAALTTTGATARYLFARTDVRDAAGNFSPELSRSIVGDATAALVTTPGVPATITGSFAASATGSDNLDLRDFFYNAGYGNAGCPMAVPFAYITACVIQVNNPPIALNTFPPIPAVLLNTNVALNTTISVALVLQETSGAGTPGAYAAAAGNALDRVVINLRDQTQAVYTMATTAGLFANLVTPAAGIAAFGGANTFITTASVTTLCAAAAASGGCAQTAGNSSTVFTATASGVTGTFNNPFSRVDFYCDNGAGLLFLIGSSSAFTLNDNGTNRTFAASVTATASNLFLNCGGVPGGAPGASITPNIFAFGVNVAGTVALVAQDIAAAFTVNP